VHPVNDHYRTLYGRHIDIDRVPRYDHYASELALLYVIVFATYELEHLLKVSRRVPEFAVAEEDQLRELLDTAQATASYLWFVGGQPHNFDRIQEANHRRWETETRQVQPLLDVSTLSDDAVRYYQDPLQRIVRLHVSTNEMMGHSFISPWPRRDAQFR
jgi:hypothetical protein